MFEFIAPIAAAASLVSGVQEPGDWRQVDDTDGYYTAVDMGSIDGPRTARTVRTVSVAADQTKLSGHVILSLVVDCEAWTLGAIHAAFFGVNGQMVMEDDGPLEPEPISEEAGTLMLARAVCDGETPTSPGFGTAHAYALSIRAAAS